MPKNYLEFLTKSVEYGILQIVNKSGQNVAKNNKNTSKGGFIMKKIIVLCIVLIVVLATGCGTLSKQDRALVREFNAIDRLSVDDINFIKAFGLDPNHLSLEDKVKVMKEGQALSAAIMMCR
ncbi:MAG: hypothetical protein A3H67_01325 [Candidatus Buchananbacteria bacterium RIFCSPLOWO2_02_FULL_46_11b]|uniref:Uncharacterized protein n=1 Tax=Candidatus Buchananbacteria bacterium RIFCSPLOWO2_02_FULL_46_11b TaxID=1797548 RepID=A0A1G1Z0W6_9BACT|nr:MAG: hypothetical protein A3H67_01325 [Candidatus Buchananbacteria bacterium RIFCSPLOWO2_02_FULL_46_11b]